MNRPVRLILAVVMILGAAALGFMGGLRMAAEFAHRHTISDAAQEVWVLERFRSIARQPTPEEADWMNQMIQARENIVRDSSTEPWVAHDKTLQEFRRRTEDLRRKRQEKAP
jgi:hypothetical protein